MMSKTKTLAMILSGVFLLGSLQVLQAQSEATEEPVVRTTTSITSTPRRPAAHPGVSRRIATRTTTPARSVDISRAPFSRPMVDTAIRTQGDLVASGLLKVSCDFSIVQLNDDVLGALLNSSFVLAEDAQEQFTIHVDSMAGKGDQILFRLIIFENPEPDDEGKDDAEAQGQEPGDEIQSVGSKKGEELLTFSPADMISKIADRLKDILIMEFDKQRNQNRGKLEEAEAELKPLEDKMRRLNDLERDLYAKAGTSSLRRNEVLKQIQSLERRKQDMEMSLVGAAAREDELQKQIAILGDQTAKKLQQDTVLYELKNILQLREDEMKTVQKMMESGNAFQSDYFKARDAVAQARIEMVKRQEAISESIGGGAAMQERVKELTDIAIENAESQAVLKHIEEQLSIIKDKKILELADQYEIEIGLKQDTMRRSYEFIQKSIQEYNYTMQRMLPPSVSVLGGD